MADALKRGDGPALPLIFEGFAAPGGFRGKQADFSQSRRIVGSAYRPRWCFLQKVLVRMPPMITRQGVGKQDGGHSLPYERMERTISRKLTVTVNPNKC